MFSYIYKFMEVTNEKEYVNTIDYNRIVVGSHSFCLHTKYEFEKES